MNCQNVGLLFINYSCSNCLLIYWHVLRNTNTNPALDFPEVWNNHGALGLMLIWTNTNNGNPFYVWELLPFFKNLLKFHFDLLNWHIWKIILILYFCDKYIFENASETIQGHGKRSVATNSKSSRFKYPGIHRWCYNPLLKGNDIICFLVRLASFICWLVTIIWLFMSCCIIEYTVVSILSLRFYKVLYYIIFNSLINCCVYIYNMYINKWTKLKLIKW